MIDSLNSIFEEQGKNRWAVAKSTAKERIAKILKLRKAIVARQQEFYDAVWTDFHKPKTEAWLSEVFPALQEIDHTVAHLDEWMEDKDGRWSPLFPTSQSVSHFEPKGRVLIMAPWNYPFLLFFAPVVAAVAAGNVVIAKPSHKTPHVAEVIESIVKEVFPQNEVAVVQGAGSEIGDTLLALPFDHMFFTGSPKIGAHVAECAAKVHAGVTLELGGKSPAIVLEDVNIKDAAKKLAWGKTLNAGQTCIAPDYLLCPKKLVQPLAEKIAKNIAQMYGETEEARRLSENFVHIVESNTVERHQSLIQDAIAKGATAVIGAQFAPEDIENRYTPATILMGITADMHIMDSEIFGPILPIIAYENIDEAIQFVQVRPKPLALYIFGKTENKINEVIARTTSGSACVNHCILQIANNSVPFGGVGMSGTGNYHGIYGFKTFSHERNVMRQGAFDTMQFFYPPYHKDNEKSLRAKMQRLMKFFLKNF
ncbi:aldehyde dehydrogenase family protein [Fibrobacter sp.]|uniref:aldehyde dehydrogenase family protein n=1 Tax=Fibrobacter sp. TaxID=35828 RepID=UPI003866401F